MSEKKNFILRIDSNTYKLLEKWAADEFRSVNGQIEYILHQSLSAAGRKNNIKGDEIVSPKNKSR
ncbi:MAG: Arc family DNA binding domain-containing protein [Sphingobacteriales bacterium]|nr:Arc family DNA binding domain-containing protein [Sphingobacteriales bacterium]